MHEPGGLRCADPPGACYAGSRSSHERLCTSPGVPMTDIDIFEAIHTARSLRRFKPDPVPEALITRILDAAIRAPSAGNAQNWAFIVVREPSVRRALGDIYQRASRIVDAMYAARGRPPHLTEQQFQRMMTSGTFLW